MLVFLLGTTIVYDSEHPGSDTFQVSETLHGCDWPPHLHRSGETDLFTRRPTQVQPLMSWTQESDELDSRE